MKLSLTSTFGMNFEFNFTPTNGRIFFHVLNACVIHNAHY